MAFLKAFAALSLIAAVTRGSMKDVKHVVMIMFENRSFDHYFGTMAGVRGFSDPNVQVNPGGLNTFQQYASRV
jgi:phospholipase C